ncbi:MAG: tetratricopeptide repeat protein [Verrucomicrobia bacterium]|nr:tetratricopeptide repeat protein [Verrucomicrobiota bacterium]
MIPFLVLCSCGGLLAVPLRLSPSMFSSEDFKERFVGSYGMLPALEPKVDREEAGLIAELGELLSKSQFGEAEVRLLAFIRERRNPSDPAVEAKEVSGALIFTLGNLYFQNDRVGDAERSYKLALNRFPDYRRAHKNLALLYATQDKIEEAKPHLMKAIELGEADHRVFGLLGYAYLKEEKVLAAEGAYRQAYLLNAGEKDWKLGLAQALMLQEKWGEAASMLESLIEESPENALLWKQQANCYIQMEEPMRAAENYEVLRLKGLADEEAMNQLGDIYANQEQALLALGAYLTAMKQSTVVNVERSLKSAKYLQALGASAEAGLYILEMKKAAGETMTEAQKVRVLVVESDVAKAEERVSDAVALLKEALELDPMNGEGRVRLGQLHVQLAEEAADEDGAREHRLEARKYFLIAVKSENGEVAYQANLRYGQMLVKESRFKEALPRLEASLRLKGSQNLEQYVRRVQRAAERQEKKEERLESEREEKMEKAKQAAEKVAEPDEAPTSE